MLTFIMVFVFFCMPEFKGHSIESIDDLFQNCIWSMWHHACPTEEDTVCHDVQEVMLQSAKDEEQGIAEERAAVALGE